MKKCCKLIVGMIICVVVAGTAFAQKHTVLSAPGSVQFSGNTIADIVDKNAGDKVCFTLFAKDKNGNIIRDWDQQGNFTTLTLRNSTANTDTNKQTWNADPDGYSWAYITQNNTKLIQVNDTQWSLPPTAFVDGQTDICFTDSKAENGVYLEITPKVGFLTKQVSDTLNFMVDAITNYLVEVTSATAAGHQVYYMRPYEIVVSPRDRYLNVSNVMIRTRFSARYPGEFDNGQPGLSNIFTGDVFITGPTNYLLASRATRVLPTDVLQWIMAYSASDATINGFSDPYEILPHAPAPFNLLTPVNHTVIEIDTATALQVFTWEKPSPVDPYTNIQISRFDPALYSDDVTYTWFITDSVSQTNPVKIASDNGGVLPQITLSKGQLKGIMAQIAGLPSVLKYNFMWYVEATDGLYITRSDPQPGFFLSLDRTPDAAEPVSAPLKLTLNQNYPNPFKAATTISFATTTTGKVTLKVYDLLGKEILTLASGTMEAGIHSIPFDARVMPSGMYIYKLTAEGKTFTKRMTMLR